MLAVFTAPQVDYHALAPELIVVATLVVVLLVDLASERNRPLLGTISGIGLLAAMVPVITLAVDGADRVVLSGNGGYVVDNFALTLKALFLIGGVRRGAHVDELHRRRRLLRGRVLLPTAVVGAGHGRHGIEPRPHHDLHRTRNPVDPGIHAGGVAQTRPEGQRGGVEVLPDGCVRYGDHALRHVTPLWRDGFDAPHRHQRATRASGHATDHHPRHRVLRRRVRLQGVGRPVPHVGA